MSPRRRSDRGRDGNGTELDNARSVHDPRSGYPASNPQQLGAGLKALRGQRGVRRLAAAQPAAPGAFTLSKSTLDRYERGEVLPPLPYARHLDDLYDGEGWVEMSVRTLWRASWDPWQAEHGVATCYHAGRWPAQYTGLVWIKVKPRPDRVDTLHEIALEWGPWGRRVSVNLPRDGLVIATGKAEDADGISRTCNLTSDLPLFTLYGAGEDLDHETVLDIRRGWAKVNPDSGPEEQHTGPAHDD